MIQTLVTVAASLTAVVLGSRLDRSGRREAIRVEERRARLEAIRELATALADHRRAMWVREDARLSGAGKARYAELRAASHVTRSALEAPLVAVRVLMPQLAAAADAAAKAAYALRGAADRDALDAGRASAIDAATALTADAARLVAA